MAATQRRRHRDHRVERLAAWSATPPRPRPRCCSRSSPARSSDAGITRADVDFTCAGSCDYVAGQAFSFVQNTDAIGAWPPKRDSHVEMDGAWAMYEAYVRLLLGDIDVAVAMGSGRSSTADPALIYPMEMDPFYLAPLGADHVSLAALQARALIDSGAVTERQMAEIAVRTRHDAIGQPATPRSAATSTSTSCWPPTTSRRRCAATTCRRSPTAPAPS